MSAPSTTDQILIRKALARQEAGFLEIEKAGILRRYLNEDAQKAWLWIEKYIDENEGQWPGDEVLVYEMEWPRDQLEDLPEMTISHCARLILRRVLMIGIDNLMTDVREDLVRGKDFIFEARDKILHAGEALSEIGIGGRRGISLFNLYPQVISNYESYKAGDVGVRTPYDTVTEAIRGWKMGTVNYFCARPSTGKTWTLLHNCLVSHDQGLTVLFLSPELSADELAERAGLMQVGLSYDKFTRGALDFFGEKKLKENLTDLSALKGFTVIEDNMVFDKAEAEAAIRRHDPDVVAIDSMYLLGRGRTRSDQISDAAPWLKAISRTGRKRIVFATAQMNRDAKDADTMVMGNIYGSDAIAQDADTIYGMFQDDSMSKDALMGFKQLKIRNGRPHPVFFTRWDLESMLFTEMKTSGYEDVNIDDDPNPFSASNY